MRAAAVSLVVPATPNRVRSHLSPRAVVEAEGRYQVLDVEREGDRTIVTVWPNGRLLAPSTSSRTLQTASSTDGTARGRASSGRRRG